MWNYWYKFYHRFDKSLELLNHRGPDFQNSIKIENKQFGHTRLAIIDLDEKQINNDFDDILLFLMVRFTIIKELIHVEHLERCKNKSDSEV